MGVAAAVTGAGLAIVLNRVSCLAETPTSAPANPPKSSGQAPAIDPGKTYNGPLAPLDEHEIDARQIAQERCREAGRRYRRAVDEPSMRKLVESAAFIEKSLQADGFQVSRQTLRGERAHAANLEVEINGAKKPAEIFIVGAHYDSAAGAPGANDNGSGVAALLALGRAFAGKQANARSDWSRSPTKSRRIFKSRQWARCNTPAAAKSARRTSSA